MGENSTKGMKIAVVLPAYNEEKTIGDVLLDFHRALPESSLWVINNQSSDSTEQSALAALERLPCGGGVINEVKRGKGNAVRRAFIQIDADIYILCDADSTYPADQVGELMAPVISGEADMVVGDRFSGGHYAIENKRPFHQFGNRFVKFLINKLFHSDLVDIMSGYRVLSRRFVKNYPVLAEGFEIETEMTLHALDKRFHICEIPIKYRDRPDGSYSKLNTFRDGLRVLISIWNIFRYYRPLIFFGTFAILFSVFGIMAGIPVLMDWITARYIYHVPLAILATGLQVLSVVMLSIGLILDSMVNQEKRRFELRLLDDQAKFFGNPLR